MITISVTTAWILLALVAMLFLCFFIIGHLVGYNRAIDYAVDNFQMMREKDYRIHDVIITNDDDEWTQPE